MAISQHVHLIMHRPRHADGHVKQICRAIELLEPRASAAAARCLLQAAEAAAVQGNSATLASRCRAVLSRYPSEVTCANCLLRQAYRTGLLCHLCLRGGHGCTQRDAR